MRIAHISDLHVARHPEFGEYNAKRLLGYMNYRLFRSRRYRESVAAASLERMMTDPPDLVLLTGDITQHGLDAEFERARSMLSVVTENRVPIVAVSGNHDIYGFSNPVSLDTFLRDVALDLRPDEFGLYRFPGVELLALEQGIPTLPFFAHGRQNPEELEKAARAWSAPPDGVMRLVCGHYPVIDPHGERLLYFRGLREAALLIEFCERHQVAGYFCGHNHKRFSAMMPGGCLQFSAPALSSVKTAGEEWASVYDCRPDLRNPVEIPVRSMP